MGSSMHDYDQIVSSIYDCAANPELWPEALGKVSNAVGGAYALLGFVDTSELRFGKPPFVLRRNSTWDEEWLLKLESMLSNMPDGGGLRDNGVDVAWSQLTQMSEADFQNTDFFKYWVQPQNLRDTINTPYLHRTNMTGMLSVPSFNTREPYGDSEMRLIERLTPHVRRAILINDLTDKGKQALLLYRQVLDKLSVAVFVIGLGRRIITMNASAEKLLSAGILLTQFGGCLQALRVAGEIAALDEAVDRATKGDLAVGISGIGVPLIGSEGERAAAYVLPLAGDDIRGSLGQGHCAVFIARPGEQHPMAMEILRTMFDMTVAEARVALLLSKGDGPQEIADALGVSVHTVRSHLKHAYAKAGVADQTGLVAMIAAIMPPLKDM